MSKPNLCCDECFVMIAKTSTVAAILWLDLCDIQFKYGIFGLVSSDSAPSLRLLEQMGFITSTESLDSIYIKVNGAKIDEFGSFFCGGKCDK
jgi:hypothetical protein